MGWPVCNTTLTDQKISEAPLAHGLTFHQIGLIICALCALFATGVSTLLIVLHATHYTQPSEQRHIIRILFMIPIYSVVSFLSFLYYTHSIYFEVLRDCYEAFAIASFFTLLCYYIAPNLHDQKDYFRVVELRDWVLPINWLRKCCGGDRGIWRKPRSGLTWFNIIWLGVYQYCFVRVFMTIVSVISQAFGRYCNESLSPAFAHVWVLVFESASVTVAMYCLIQFYLQLKDELAPHKPGIKIACIKLVIFFAFWQSTLISFLTSARTNLVTPSDSISYSDLTDGIPSLLLCIEMALFSILHIFAFPYKGYRSSNVSAVSEFYEGAPGNQGGFLGIKAYVDAFNPWDLIKAVGRGFRWLFVGRKKRLEDESYKSSIEALGMEPRRDGAAYSGSRGSSGYTGPSIPGIGSKPSRYQRVDGEEDLDLLRHAQSNPTTGAQPYVGRHPTLGPPLNETGDIGDVPSGPQRWDQDADNQMSSHPAPTAAYSELEPSSGAANMYISPTEHDTSYHGAAPRPAPRPQGAEWNMWAGAQGTESNQSTESFERAS